MARLIATALVICEVAAWCCAYTQRHARASASRLSAVPARHRRAAGRLRLLASLIRTAIERLELLERAQVRALSNGKVRFG